MSDRWFAVASALVVILMIGSAVAVSATGGDSTDELDHPLDPPDTDLDPPTESGVAEVNGEEFGSVQSAVDAAGPGETVVLRGVFDERVTIDTRDLRIVGHDGPQSVMIDGGGEETVITITAKNVTLADFWIRESGYDRSSEDAAILLDGPNATISGVHITDVTFGVWINGVSGATIEDSTIVGREDITTLAQRGNGIHLWEADSTRVINNTITDARDGIYFSFSEGVIAEGNVMWNLRYGVHYMYSSDNRLTGNQAFDNDIGFALMVSENLTIEHNIAADNRGPSGHGILVKEIDRSDIRNNHVVNNGNGFYVYNAQDNRITDNLILENDRGIQVTGGTQGELVAGNSFIDNGESAYVDTRAQVHWNDSDRGNYWSDARVVDLDGDGISEVRHQPAGTVEELVNERPQAGAFVNSPAFDVVRLAESSFPAIVSPGAVDHKPLAEPNHDPGGYYANND